MSSTSALQRIIGTLPSPFLKFGGRLYERSALFHSLIDPILDHYVGEGVIQRGPGKGLRIDASGRKAGYLFGTSDQEEQRFLSDNLDTGNVFYEIGANIGFFALIGAKLVGRSGQVYTFEPSPQSINQLRKNITLNDFQNVEVQQTAVLDTDGSTTLNLSTDSGKSSVGPVRSRIDSIQVPSVKLDTWVEDHTPPDVLKIDVEGAEIEVLKGAMRTIQQFRPLMLVEVHRIGSEFSQYVTQQLAPIGYVGSTLGGDPLPDSDGIRFHAVLYPKDKQ